MYSSILTQVPWNLWDLSLYFSPFSINDNKMNSHSHCRIQLKPGFFFPPPWALWAGSLYGDSGKAWLAPVFPCLVLLLPPHSLWCPGWEWEEEEEGERAWKVLLERTVVTGIGAPEWLGCHSADADSCGERSFRDSGPSIFPRVAPLILAVAPAAGHLWVSPQFLTIISLLDHLDLPGGPFKAHPLFSSMEERTTVLFLSFQWETYEHLCPTKL